MLCGIHDTLGVVDAPDCRGANVEMPTYVLSNFGAFPAKLDKEPMDTAPCAGSAAISPVREPYAMKTKKKLLAFVVLCVLGSAVFLAGCRQEGRLADTPGETPPPEAAFSMDRAFLPLETDTHPETLRSYTTLQPEDNPAILDEVLARVFPERLEAPGETEVLAVLSYVAQTLKLQSSTQHAGSAVLADGFAYCYGMARAFESLCRRMGMPARINAVHNFEYMQAHNMAEVYYDGQWHLFDPTYGVFFYDRAVYDGSGRIPAARELFSGSISGRHAFMSCESLWTGRYAAGQHPKALPDDFRYRGAFTLRELYDRVLSVGFPFIEANDRMSSFPFTIEMEDAATLSIGTVDGAIEDVEGRRENASYPRYHGAAYLGRGSTGAVFHTVTFQSAAPARFKMTYHFLRGSLFDAMGVIELRDIIVERYASKNNTWSVWFRLQSDEGTFAVVNRRDVAVVDAITVEREE